MPKIEFSNFYEKRKECTYTRVPFELPEGVESFTLSYSYDKTFRRFAWYEEPNRNSVDLSLLSPNGELVGCSERSKDSVFISAHYATPGYIAQEISSGIWEVLLGFDMIKTEGVTVNLTVEYRLKGYRWLKGDPHTHTLHSDGRYTNAELVARARKVGLDYIIITDHNVAQLGTAIPESNGFLAMRGMEVTNYVGHVNLWGAARPFKGAYSVGVAEELTALLEEAHDNGCVVSINHPTCKDCGFHLPINNFEYDCIEVWNGPMRIDNMTALQWWHQQLLTGKRIPCVGGSDYHRDYIITRFLGNPTTVTYAKSLSERDILDALKKGACYVTHHPDSTKLFLTCGENVMGDEVPLQEDTVVTVHCNGLKRRHRLVVYNNDKIIYKFTGKKDHTATVAVAEKGFVRAEVLYDRTAVGKFFYHQMMKIFLPADVKLPVPTFAWAITNPIYFV